MSAPTTNHPVAQFAGLAVMPVGEMADDYGRWLIHGPQGSGKTRLASTIGECGQTLFIDLTGEHGVRSFKGAPFAANMQVIRPVSITALDDVFWPLNNGGHDYKAVMVDTVTAVQKMVMRFLLGHDETAVREIRQGTAPAQIRTWGQCLDVMVDIATFWYGLADGGRDKPIHVVMTAQTSSRRSADGNAGGCPTCSRVPSRSCSRARTTSSTRTSRPFSTTSATTTFRPVNHIVRFGTDPIYRTKARLPYPLQGKMPAVLGRKQPTNLMSLSSVLGVGGVPSVPKKATRNPTRRTEHGH